MPSSFVQSGLPLDPWGRAWRLPPKRPYSTGPDGIDSNRNADDVTRDDIEAHPLYAWAPKVVLACPRVALIAAAFLLAVWTLLTRETLRAPHARLALEARRAAFVAAVPGLLGFVWVYAGIPRLEQRFVESGAGGFVQVPAWIAVPLSWALLCYLPALAWRLSRPRPGAAT